MHAIDAPDQRGLAASRRPHDSRDPIPLNGEVDVPHHLGLAKTRTKILRSSELYFPSTDPHLSDNIQGKDEYHQHETGPPRQAVPLRIRARGVVENQERQ